MKLDKNEKVQVTQLCSNVITDIVRYHILNKEDSYSMEEFVKKMDDKVIRDSFFDLIELYKINKRKFNYTIVGRETVSQKLFNGLVHVSYAQDTQYSFIEYMKNLIIEFNKIFSIFHHAEHKKHYFSPEEIIQNFLITKDIASGTRINKLVNDFVFEYFPKKHSDKCLKESVFNDEGEFKKDIKDILNSLIERYIPKNTTIYNLNLDLEKEVINTLLDYKYLFKNRPLCRTLSEISSLHNNVSLKLSITSYTHDTHPSLIDLIKDSYKNVYSDHLPVPPLIYKEDNGVYSFIVPIFYNKNSKISKVHKGLISKNINRVLKHLSNPISYRDIEVIVPKYNNVNNNHELQLKELSGLANIRDVLFSNDRFIDLLKSKDITELDKKYLTNTSLILNHLINDVSLNMVPERTKMLFLLSTLNDNNIYYKVKERILSMYRIAFNIVNENINFDNEDLNNFSENITLKNRVRGTVVVNSLPNQEIESTQESAQEEVIIKEDKKEEITLVDYDSNKHSEIKKGNIFQRFINKFFRR